MNPIDEKFEKLLEYLKNKNSVIVAFSGGVDSTFLAWSAVKALGRDNVLAVTAISPSLSHREHDSAQQVANQIGVNYIEINTEEINIEAYRKNAPDRCLHCKKELYSKLLELSKEKGIDNVVDGTNADEVHGHRPGMKAVQELGISSPLQEVGLTKNEIRQLSKKAGLPTWNKPSLACLASRIPYDSEITEAKLNRIGLAEEFLLGFGFRQVRVRDHYPIARIELEVEDMKKVLSNNNRNKIETKLKDLGYKFVTLDLAGFRSGSMNVLIDKENID